MFFIGDIEVSRKTSLKYQTVLKDILEKNYDNDLFYLAEILIILRRGDEVIRLIKSKIHLLNYKIRIDKTID